MLREKVLRYRSFIVAKRLLSTYDTTTVGTWPYYALAAEVQPPDAREVCIWEVTLAWTSLDPG